MTDEQTQMVERAKQRRAYLVASGVSLDDFPCTECGLMVRYAIVGQVAYPRVGGVQLVDAKILPCALHALGEICRKSETGFHNEHYAKDGRDQDGGCPWCGRDCPDAGKPQGCWYQGCPDFPHGE